MIFSFLCGESLFAFLNSSNCLVCSPLLQTFASCQLFARRGITTKKGEVSREPKIYIEIKQSSKTIVFQFPLNQPSGDPFYSVDFKTLSERITKKTVIIHRCSVLLKSKISFLLVCYLYNDSPFFQIPFWVLWISYGIIIESTYQHITSSVISKFRVRMKYKKVERDDVGFYILE